MGNLEVQCMNLGLVLEMMDMDFNQFLGGGNRTNSILLFVAWKNGRELSIHMNKIVEAEAWDFSAGMLVGLPTHAGWYGWNVTPEAAPKKKGHWA